MQQDVENALLRRADLLSDGCLQRNMQKVPTSWRILPEFIRVLQPKMHLEMQVEELQYTACKKLPLNQQSCTQNSY
ncbi:hypothetical protein T265_13338 [Opisthorchis viverrini]|uniref:Uncharacterized protein n=1 Tax=Opisthorchis viverrini TaxID=6198 RepID=A0A075AHB9_OPIVI|nr:hypothetical protein T265_13338 [Opisthorchis viverrini]KER29614.1 hypothetical protein T265_13338 [Opisthorchis viverrini]